MELLAQIVSWACLGAGSILVIVGGLGLLRLPDFYTRIHAAGITDTLGAWLILVGLMFHEGFTLITAKLVLVLVFLVLTSPTASHALAKAAYFRGLEPFLAKKEGDDHPTD